MLIRTHIAASLLLILSLWSYVTGKISFTAILLFSTLLPDIDVYTSLISRKIKPISKIFAFITKHRGLLHSITFCIIFAVILALFNPKLALPFFLGYSLHLLADSFTIQGIKAFWPSKIEIKGMIRTGGLSEKMIFYVLIGVDIIILLSLIT